MQFRDTLKVFREWMLLPNPTCLELGLAVLADTTKGIQGDPIWLFLKARSGGAKSEIIRAMQGEWSLEISNLTPRTFISGRTDLGKGDLLRHLDGRCLLMKDFTIILQKNPNDRGELLAQLRGMYDGTFTSAYGSVAGIKRIDSKFNFLAGVTQAIDRYSAVQNTLGERFLMIDTQIPDSAADMAFDCAGKEKIMRQELSIAVQKQMIDLPEYSEKTIISSLCRKKLLALAKLLATLRTGVDRNYRGDIYHLGQPEVATRVAKQFHRLFLALTLIHPKSSCLELYKRIEQVALDSIPENRFYYLKTVFDMEKGEGTDRSYDEFPNSTEIANSVNKPTSYVTKILDDLFAIGAIKRYEGHPAKWNVSTKGLEYLSIISETKNERKKTETGQMDGIHVRDIDLRESKTDRN